MKLNVIYRISDGSYKKDRLPHATKPKCLWSFIKNFQPDYLHVLMDGCTKETTKQIEEITLQSSEHYQSPYFCTTISGGSSAQSFNRALDTALLLPIDEYVLFAEDDYLWLPNSRMVLEEGLARADYVAPYLHPDKFIPATSGGNPEVDDAGSTLTRIFKTQSSFWMMCNSTTMTFATSVRVLKEDETTWRKYTTGTYPRDYDAFIDLRSRGRTLVQPIPTIATHTEIQWLAPLIGTSFNSWETV